MHDVIVIGAGPAGLYAALRMAEEGLGVLVLEEHAGIGFPTHCTGVVSAETNRLYKIPEEIVLNRPSACLVVSPGGCKVEFPDPGEEIAVLDRAGFDQALAASAQEAGAAVRTDCRVERVGFPVEAKHRRSGKAKVYPFNRVRHGKFYEQKRVEVIYTMQTNEVVTVTVYVFYGKWGEPT